MRMRRSGGVSRRPVEQVVARPAVETLHEAVPLRLARRDVTPLDPAPGTLSRDGVAGPVGPVAADGHPRLSPAPDQNR